MEDEKATHVAIDHPVAPRIEDGVVHGGKLRLIAKLEEHCPKLRVSGVHTHQAPRIGRVFQVRQSLDALVPSVMRVKRLHLLIPTGR